MVLSDGRYSDPVAEGSLNEWVLHFIRPRLVAKERLRLLDEMMSEMKLLQSTHTSMVLQSSVSSLGSSMSSREDDAEAWRDDLDSLKGMEEEVKDKEWGKKNKNQEIRFGLGDCCSTQVLKRKSHHAG